ncbi:hypothetical protein Tco_0551989 [Tanacetum coccineum]
MCFLCERMRLFRIANMDLLFYEVGLRWFEEAEEAFLHNVSKDKETTKTTAGVAVGLRIREEEWRGKDTSLTYLKLLGYEESPGYPKQRYYNCGLDLWSQNDSIVAEHGLSLEITQSLGGSLDTSKGSENSGSFENSGRSDEEYSKDGASSKDGENGEPESYSEALSSKESVQWKKAIIEEMVSLKMNQTCSLARLPARKNASQSLWMFRVKEEQDGSKRYKARLMEPSYVGALNDTSTQQKSEGFQLAGQKENLECRLKEIMCGLIQAPRLRYLKFDSFMQKDKALTWQNSTSLSESKGLQLGKACSDIDKCRVLIFFEDSWNEEPCNDVHQVGDEIEVEVLRNFNWPLSKLITEDGFLPERGAAKRVYCMFDDNIKVRAVALLKGRWFKVYRDYLIWRAIKRSASKWEIIEL